MPLKPYRLEIVFAGLCAFELDEKGATVLLVNATDDSRFSADEELEQLGFDRPVPHYPQLSFSMIEQIRHGHPARLPDRIASGPSGEEIGICNVFEEDLVVEVDVQRPFEAGPLEDAIDLGSLVSGRLNALCHEALPNRCVGTRLRVDGGILEVFSLAPAGGRYLEIDMRPLRSAGKPSGQPARVIADRMIWSIDGVTRPVKIHSDKNRSLRFRPDPRLETAWPRFVRLGLSNYHDQYHRPGRVSTDFLWLYELIEHGLSRFDLPVPLYLNGPGGYTGSSGVCPPGTIV